MTKTAVTAENRPAWECGQGLHSDRVIEETHENQCVAEVFVVLLRVNIVVLRRLSFVRGVEIMSGVVALDGWEVLPECLLDAGVSDQLVGPHNLFYISGTHQ